jgi:pimeloyl-ACP methyl ester carboxylesterase
MSDTSTSEKQGPRKQGPRKQGSRKQGSPKQGGVAPVPAGEGFRTSGFVHEGRTLVYDEYGSGERVLVYMHGLLLDSDLNRGIADALAGRGHRVVLLDLLGHGRSDTPAHASEYRIDSYADQVFALMDHLGIDSATLGGLSLGANVSLFAASQHPERVNGLVLEMPVLEWAVPTAGLTFVSLLLAAHYGAPVLGAVTSRIRRLPRTPWGPVNSLMGAASHTPEVMAAILHGVLVGPVAPTQEQRSAIQAPTLVLGHRNDLIHPFDDAVNLCRQLPDAELVPARSPLELRLRPERLTDCIAEFLDRLPVDGRAGAARRSRARAATAPGRTGAPGRRTSTPA